MIIAILVLLVSLLTAGGGPAQSGPAARPRDPTAARIMDANADWPDATRAGFPTRVFEGSSPSGVHTSIGTALIGGNISQAAPSYGPRYLAVRAPRGSLVRICAETCVVMRSTDFGPSSKIRPPRIADVALVVWRRVCGEPDSAGLCRGSVEFLGAVRVPAPPATDTE